MNEPLWTKDQAHAEASHLLVQFDRNPDVLSPSEQALAMGIREMEQRSRDFNAAQKKTFAAQIRAIARRHYARDISGTYAMNDWEAFAKALCEPLSEMFID